VFFRGKAFAIFRNLESAKPRNREHAIFGNLEPANPRGRGRATFRKLEPVKLRSREHAKVCNLEPAKSRTSGDGNSRICRRSGSEVTNREIHELVRSKVKVVVPKSPGLGCELVAGL
jgi:hypothetical protein